ncbi:STM3941 family protein [Neolewinella antarctica]|uniref:Uncharacterized protein n=1 Tax=Neolewinella antarctica TaxID=442734 RepID=A0ABX0XI02_9BACT|nr:STM3941 family protein [Neolewinella antarctica]NJC28383.1 hypothetical protein [Neolewinella antarctica]
MDYPYLIQRSKKKSYLAILACLLFVGLGVFTLALDTNGTGSAMIMTVIGWLNIILFTLGAVFFASRLRKKQLPLEITDEGIRDNSSFITPGLTRWEDIKGFRFKKAIPQSVILIDVHDPEAYVQKVDHPTLRANMRHNVKTLGSPAIINTTAIDVSPRKLFELLQEELKFQQTLRSSPGITLPELLRQRDELFR